MSVLGEFSDMDILMLRKLEAVREHFQVYDSEFRHLVAELFIGNSWTFENKQIKDRNEYEHLIKGDLSEYRKPIEYPTEYNGQKVYGMKDWNKGFDEQFKPGELFTSEIAEYFLDVLPPACWSSTFVQVGEPHDHRKDKDGNFKSTYATFEAVKGTINDVDSVWKYCGNCFKGEHEEFRG